MTWRKGPLGWVTTDGRWRIRGPVYGKPMFWLYGPHPQHHGRYTPTGNYEDVVNFPTARAAKDYVATLYATD